MELDAKLKTALDESRLLILGAQVLFGFQFQSVFQELFAEVPRTSQLVQCAGLLLLLIAFEWEHYRRLLQWGTLPITAWDRVVLMWILFAKTMWPLFVVLVVSALLRSVGRTRLASAVTSVSAASSRLS